MKNFKTILFDLDGTLIDHFNVIYRCYAHTFRTLGLPELDYDAVKRSVGGSFEVTMKELVDSAVYQDAVRIYRQHFSEIFLDDVTVLPGVEWLLPALKERGVQLAVFTNKQGPGSRAICDHLGLTQYLDAVFGSHDTPYRKPDPRFAQHVLTELGATAATTCLVGDSSWDVAAARGVGMPSYCVTTGTHSRNQLLEAGADAVFTDFYELGHHGFGLEPETAATR